jgi:hypothetical protein
VIGIRIRISGASWKESSSVTISSGLWGTSTPSVTASTDENGSFSKEIRVQSGQPGENLITVRDANGNVKSAKFTLPDAIITLDPITGGSGIWVTVKGTGFTAYDTVTVKFDGALRTTDPAVPIVDSKGAFECKFVVPPKDDGQYIVMATAGSKNAAATFEVAISQTVESALASLGTKLVRVWHKDATEGWQVYDPINNIKQFDTMVKGDAYWIKVSGTATLTYSNGDTRTISGANWYGWY